MAAWDEAGCAGHPLRLRSIFQQAGEAGTSDPGKGQETAPYPYWLEPYFFGTFEREQWDSERAKERWFDELRGVRHGIRTLVEDPEKVRKFYEDL